MDYRKIYKSGFGYVKPLKPKTYRKSKTNIARTVNKIINKDVEYHFKDVAPSVSLSATGTLTLLNGLTTGDTDQTRQGKKVTVKSIQLGGTVSTTTEDTVVRAMLVYDKQANGDAPSILDILTAKEPGAFKNLDNRKRFIILMDRVIPLSLNEGASVRKVEYYKRHNLPVIYNQGTAGTISDISTGSIYLILFATVSCLSSVKARIRFLP